MDDALRGRFQRGLYAALDRLGADPDLLSIIGSYGDTLDDKTIVSLLEAYNANGTAMERVICSVDGDETPVH